MKKFFYSTFFFGTLVSFCFAQPNNINISNTTYFNGEPFLAMNPTNRKNIIIAWMGYNYSVSPSSVTITTEVSFDGGTTWGNTFYIHHLASNYTSADVSIAFSKTGSAYLSFIDSDKSIDSGGVYVCKSVNDGVTWGTPVKAWDASETGKMPIDRPWLVIDNSSSTNSGTLYLTTKPPSTIPAPNRPYLKFSSDSGVTWSNYRYIDSTGFLVGNILQPMASPAVKPDGQLCIVYPSIPAFGFVLAKSNNKGATFTYHTFCVPSANSDTLIKAGYRLVADANDSNKLAFAWIDGRNGDPDVYAVTTSDGGQTWTSPTRVNDDPIGDGKFQDMVWASYDTNGNLLITWRDRRNASGIGYSQPTDMYCSVSHDNGNTFGTNVQINSVTAPFNTVLDQNGNDFMTNTFFNDTIYACWGDVRTGHLNIFFTKTAASTGLGIQTLVQSQKIPEAKIFPNPNDGKNIFLQFISAENSDAVISVYDALGKIIFEKNISLKSGVQNIPLSLQKLSKGTYFCKVISDENNTTVPFIVN